jgi:homoserine dehydrogenase
VTFDLVLVGFGNVARRFVDLVHERRRALAREFGFDVRVIGVITRRHGAVWSSKGLDARRLARTLAAGGVLPAQREGARSRQADQDARAIDALAAVRSALAAGAAAARQRRLVLVETTTLDITHGEPAITHVEAGLAAGAHVVTANKGPAAFAWHRLARRAARAGRHFLFEGAVMDGIPVFNLVRETLPSVTIRGFRGVVNTTTNFILSAMEDGGAFDDALREMQRAGIAEADASLDVDGWDAAAKTAALANVLLGARMTPLDVDREGISRLTPADLEAARRNGRRVKLVASARREGARVAARVAPEELSERDLLAQLDREENAIVFDTDLLDEVAIVQRGSGLTQTAYALVSDLVTIARASRR